MSEKKILTAEDIINAGPGYEYVEVETKDGVFRLGSVDADAMITWTEENADPVQKRIGSIRLINASLVNEAGDRIGSDQIIQALKRKSPKVIAQLIEAVLKLNGLSDKNESLKNDSGEVTNVASPTA